MIKHEFIETTKLGNKKVDVNISLELYQGNAYVWSKFDEFEACDSIQVDGSLEFVEQYIKETGVLDNSIKNLELEMKDKFKILKNVFGE